jgi:hypothetical protein
MNERAKQELIAKLRETKPWSEELGRAALGLREDGESTSHLASRLGVSPARLFWWVVKFREQEESVGDQIGSVPFVPVVVTQKPLDNGQQCPIVVVVGQGLSLEVNNLDACSAAWVGLVLRSLRESP